MPVSASSPDPAYRILGIDPGSVRTGFGLIRVDGQRLHLVVAGAISPRDACSMPERLAMIFEKLEQVIQEGQPREVAVESLFHAKNARSALLLGHARGVALLAAARRDLPLFEYAPQEVKKALVGTGRAEKQQVQVMVKLLLGLAEPVRPLDASDAVAIAICHAHSRRLRTIGVAATHAAPGSMR